MDVLWLKVILLLLMIALTVAAGLVPMKVLKLLRKSAAVAATSEQQRKASLALCLLTCFSGGVFLATCFLHLLPEVNEQLHKMQDQLGQIDYPVAEALSCAGFFLVFFLEELVLIALPGLAHSHDPPHLDHADGDGPLGVDIINHNDLCCSPARTRSVTEDEDEIGPLKQQTQHPASGETDTRHALLANQRRSNSLYQPSVNMNRLRSRVTTPDFQSAGFARFTFANYGSMSVPAAVNNLSHYEWQQSMVTQGVYNSLALAEPERCETNCKRDEDPPILMASRPHAHSHGVRSFTFVLALSFHSIIEGLAFGVQDTSGEVWALFLSLIVHKVIVAFSVGLQLARTHAHALHWVFASIMLLALMSPLGSVVGIFVQNSAMDSHVKNMLILIFQGLAVGTFLYVTFFEVLLHERDNEHPNMLKLLVIVIGFLLIGSLRLLEEKHDHSGHAHLVCNFTSSSTTRLP